jgi:ABC-type amino acid transport substrate-binding protein
MKKLKTLIADAKVEAKVSYRFGRRLYNAKARLWLPAVVVAKLVVVAFLAFHAAPALAADKESVYDRVMRTGTIRCGYGVWAPALIKDPNTGQISGTFHDYVEAMGKALNLKIEWTEEVAWGDYIAGLTNDRFDAYCTEVALNAERARQVDFLTPIMYLAGEIYVKAGDTRFDGHPEKLNSPDIKLTTVEGDVYAKISNREFPLAKKLELPQLATTADIFSSVADGKADALITQSDSGADFMKNNPGKIRKVKLDGGPFRASPVSISIKGGEYRFQRMLDIATVEMLSNGTIKSILDKYDPNRTGAIDTAATYKVAK